MVDDKFVYLESDNRSVHAGARKKSVRPLCEVLGSRLCPVRCPPLVDVWYSRRKDCPNPCRGISVFPPQETRNGSSELCLCHTFEFEKEEQFLVQGVDIYPKGLPHLLSPSFREPTMTNASSVSRPPPTTVTVVVPILEPTTRRMDEGRKKPLGNNLS